MRNILVSDIMTRDPVMIKPDANLLDCAKKMVRNRTKSLPLVEHKKLVGFISSRDILWALIKKSKEDLVKIKAIDISPRKIATIKPSATIKEAINKMKKLKFFKLPVIKNKEILGIITIKDILSFYPQLYPELEEFAQIKEEANKLKRIKKAEKRKITQGICEECGNEDYLYRVNDTLLCEPCMNSI